MRKVVFRVHRIIEASVGTRCSLKKFSFSQRVGWAIIYFENIIIYILRGDQDPALMRKEGPAAQLIMQRTFAPEKKLKSE